MSNFSSNSKGLSFIQFLLSLSVISFLALSHFNLKKERNYQQKVIGHKYTLFFAVEGISSFIENLDDQEILKVISQGKEIGNALDVDIKNFSWHQIFASALKSFESFDILLSCYSDSDQEKLDCKKIQGLENIRIKFSLNAKIPQLGEEIKKEDLLYKRDIERRFSIEE